jgi:polar amino acid transport system substrate-binding protein
MRTTTRRSPRSLIALGALAASSVLLVACGGGSSSTTSSSAAPAESSAAPAESSAAPAESSAAPAAVDGLLGQILETGVLRVSTDPAYPPQSSYDEATGEWQGFDIDVANEIATRMGVVTQWETPSWDVITAGNWNDRWDISVGSMSITEERAQVLDFSEPYYFTPAGVAVQADSDIQSIDQLAGKRVGVCGACTYEFYLNRTLAIPGFNFEFLVPEDVEIVTYDTDSTALQDLKLGRVDAVVSAVPTIEEAIKKGREIRLVGDPVFLEPLAVAADKSSSLSVTSLMAEINSIIAVMHADGTLSELSMKWYGVDITKGPGA